MFLLPESSSDPEPTQKKVPPSFQFVHCTVDQVRTILPTIKPTYFPADQLPDWILRDVANKLAPIVTTLINRSLDEGWVPLDWKQGLVSPLLKKPALYPEDPPSHSPIANLTILSKVTEKLVAPNSRPIWCTILMG